MLAHFIAPLNISCCIWEYMENKDVEFENIRGLKIETVGTDY